MFDKRLMQVCPESKKYIIGNIIIQWLELCLNALMILEAAGIAGALYADQLEGSVLLKKTVVIAVTIVLRFFTTKAAVRMSYLAARTVKKTMRGKIYAKLLRMGNSYREHVTTAELVQESVEGIEQLESYFGQYVPQFFYAFLAPLTLFLLFGFAGSWITALVLLICVPLIPGAIMMVQKIAKKLLSKYWGQYTQLGSTFLENLQGMTTLKTYQADEFKNIQMNEESERFRVVTMKVLTMQLNSVTIMDFFAYGGAALGILLATRAFIHGSIPLANCIFMILLSADFFLPMRRLGSYFHVAMNGMAASDKIFRFLNEKEPPVKKGILSENAGEIRLTNIRFSYDGEKEVLHNVDIHIPKGSFTAIVGESGSGKSTVASLIMGRHVLRSERENTEEGGMPCRLTMDGMDIDSISEESLMNTVTYVGFGSVFFKGTVRENLILAEPEASDERLWKVLDQCMLAELFRNENGLDSALSENAANLSGGQRQRLALARAILHDTPVYIFDEATSNIDVESEEMILRSILELAKNKTVILISHRLANVVTADRIFCLDGGRLAEEGSHGELLERNGVYARLWKTQQELENYGLEKKEADES